MTPSARKRATLFAVEFHGEFAHARNVALGDDNFVERFEYLDQGAVAHNFGMKHGARVESVAVLAPALKRGVEIGKTDLGKETKRAQVHAEDWRAGCSEDTRNRE